MPRSLLLLALVGAGCNSPEADWQKAPRTHRCSPEQMQKVEAENDYCIKRTGFFSEACYGFAIMRNCEPLATPTPCPCACPEATR